MSDLPEGWAATHIAEITKPAFKNDLKNDPDKKIWYIDISSIDSQAQAVESPQRLMLSEAPSRARQIVQTGDVLFSLVRPYLRKIAPVTPKFDGEVASSGFAVLRSATGIDPKFLFFKAISHDFVAALTEDQYGVSYPAVKEDQVKSQALELPPLNEQRRIVEKIEKLFAELDMGEESLQTAKAKAALYRQSLLKHAFEGHLTADWRVTNPDKLESPDALLTRIQTERDAWLKTESSTWQDAVTQWQDRGETGPKPRRVEAFKNANPISEAERETLPNIPDEWHFCRLCELAYVGSGMSVSKERKHANPISVSYLRVGNVQRGFLDLDEIKKMPIERSQLFGLALRLNDVLFNEGGDRDKLGRGWVWKNQVEPCITQNHVFRATPFHSNANWSKFISYWGNSAGQQYFEKGGKQTTNLASINKTVLNAFPIPTPSPAEMVEIVNRLEAKLSTLDALEGDLDIQIAHSKALRQSILKRAFSGQLVPQDPSDEPASKLLERIKAEKTGMSKSMRKKKANA